jgi:DNA-binding beta-propeller fold protein YncE
VQEDTNTVSNFDSPSLLIIISFAVSVLSGTFLYHSRGQFGIEDAEFSSPEGIAVDQAGNVYVTDTGNNRIQVFSSNGTFVSEFGEYGLSEQELRYPSGIAVDLSSSNVYVADTGNNRFSAFAASAPTSDTAFSSEEVQINGNDTGDQMIIPGLF